MSALAGAIRKLNLGLYALAGVAVGLAAMHPHWVPYIVALIILAIATLSKHPLALILGGGLGTFLLLDVALDRQFSQIVILRPPFFVTEVSMALLVAVLALTSNLRLPEGTKVAFFAVVIVCVLGVMFNGPKFGWLPTLRDSAELYYIAFVPITYSVLLVCDRYISARWLQPLLSIGSVFLPIFYLLSYAHVIPGPGRIPEMSESVSGMLLIGQLIWGNTGRLGWLRFLGIPLSILSLIEPGLRGPLFGTLAALGLTYWMSYAAGNRPVQRRLGKSLLVMGVGAISVLVLDPAAMVHVAKNFDSAFILSGTGSQIANNHWRLLIWKEAIQQFLSNPLAIRVGQPWTPVVLLNLGYGGVSNVNSAGGYGLNTTTLSNSYLQMVQWYGVWALGWVLLIGFRAVKPLVRLRALSPTAIVLTAWCVLWAVVTGVEVVLEGPYMSALIWSLIGACYYWAGHRAARRMPLSGLDTDVRATTPVAGPGGGGGGHRSW